MGESERRGCRDVCIDSSDASALYHGSDVVILRSSTKTERMQGYLSAGDLSTCPHIHSKVPV